MARTIINTVLIDNAFLKRLSRLYESGLTIKGISLRLEMDQQSTIRLLKMLGYNTGVLVETWLTD